MNRDLINWNMVSTRMKLARPAKPGRKWRDTAISMVLRAGPLNGERVAGESLDPLKVKFVPRTGEIHVYVHLGDGEYLYSPDQSAAANGDWETWHTMFGGTTFEIVPAKA